MSFFRAAKIAIITLAAAAAAGCGSSQSSTSTDPFASNTRTSTGGTIFGNLSTASGRTGISLAASPGTVDVDNGQVLVTATVLSDGSPVPGARVSFQVDGPATIQSGMTAVTTNSDGTAITRLTTGNTPSTTNVIVTGSVTVAGKTAIAKTSVQIVRGGGVIMFSDHAGIEPSGQVNLLVPSTAQVPASNPPLAIDFMHLIPFKLTDANGHPRVGVPVTISVYSITSLTPTDVTINFLMPPVTEPNHQTITTDSAGQGIFNAAITVPSPSTPGRTNVTNVVFKAVTDDPIPVTAYLGASYSVTRPEPPTP